MTRRAMGTVISYALRRYSAESRVGSYSVRMRRDRRIGNSTLGKTAKGANKTVKMFPVTPTIIQASCDSRGCLPATYPATPKPSTQSLHLRWWS